MLAAAREGLRDGLSPLGAAGRCALGAFVELPDPERVVLNLHSAYADISGSQVDLVQAFADAVAFNGGPMHTAV